MISRSVSRSDHSFCKKMVNVAVIAACITMITTAAVGAVDIRESLVGRQDNGAVVLPTNQVITPAGTHIEFLGRPNAVTISPDLKTAAILNGAYKAIILLDLKTETVKQEFDAAGSSASYNGIIYSHDGKQLFASQANGSIIIADVQEDGTLTLNQLFTDLPQSTHDYPGREDGNPYPGGLALSEDGGYLYVTLSRNNSIGVIDLSKNEFVKEVPVGNVPHEITVKGNKAYVSNRGGRLAEEGDFTNDSSGTPIVADVEQGRAISGTVSVIDLETLEQTKSIEVGLHPSALLIHGNRLFVANSNSDTVSVIDVNKEKVVKTINVEPFPNAPFGSSPNGLTMIGDHQLVVSLGRNNALALYGLGEKSFDAVEFHGLIPTAWYPIDVVAEATSNRLIIANGKGVGSLGPEATVGPDSETNKTGRWVHSNMGSASIIPFPTPQELHAYTKQVIKNNNWKKIAKHGKDRNENSKGRYKRDHHSKHKSGQKNPVPIPKKLGDPSVFKHVFYIIKENRTYDQVFGALPMGNGSPELVQFGRDVTPNQHAMAEQFVLFDNLYDSGSNSQDGHAWVTQAFVTDYIERTYGGFTRTYSFNGGDAMNYASSGFIWENAMKHGKSVRVYGEFVSGLKADGVDMGPWMGWLGGGKTEAGVWADFFNDSKILAGEIQSDDLHVTLEAYSDIPSLESIINKEYPPYHMVIPDQYRTEVFLKEFKQYVQNNNLPDFVIIALTNDHTEGLTPNYPTPHAMVADNDLAVGRIVEAVATSLYWKDSVIFIIEDDAQNGVDHVDGHRTIGNVISPYTRRGIVESTYLTQIDFIRVMEQILGLPPMNQMDMSVDPQVMANIFMQKPDMTPFIALPNQIPLDEFNPSLAKLKGLRKEWAIASSNLDFSKPDVADEEILNRAIWYGTKGFDKPYPGDERVLRPDEVHAYIEAKTKKQLDELSQQEPEERAG
ncbi:MAG: bifunctional YncE family protein/alkaline phosphatase family protein [Candidatus Thiodiazotropha sp.]